MLDVETSVHLRQLGFLTPSSGSSSGPFWWLLHRRCARPAACSTCCSEASRPVTPRCRRWARAIPDQIAYRLPEATIQFGSRVASVSVQRKGCGWRTARRDQRRRRRHRRPERGGSSPCAIPAAACRRRCGSPPHGHRFLRRAHPPARRRRRLLPTPATRSARSSPSTPRRACRSSPRLRRCEPRPTSPTRCVPSCARGSGSAVDSWSHLRTDVIPHGLPDQAPPFDQALFGFLTVSTCAAITVTPARYRARSIRDAAPPYVVVDRTPTASM